MEHARCDEIESYVVIVCSTIESFPLQRLQGTTICDRRAESGAAPKSVSAAN